VARTHKRPSGDSLHQLSLALARASEVELIEGFLKSLLTPSELENIATRWALVRLIDQGMSQRRIAEALGLSLCKITRGSRELKKENSAFARMIHIVGAPESS
jgi:TrpR family trp operon transcriptional repressor